MGREIRRVPPHWEHPTDDAGHFRPMHDQTFEEAATVWKNELAAWERGERDEYFRASEFAADFQYWEWTDNPPDRECYRPAFAEGATWLQMYETVSEGTPVTPPFATPEELIDHLCESGESLTGSYNAGPWTRQNAEAFVKSGWALSLVVSGGKIYTPRDGLPEHSKREANVTQSAQEAAQAVCDVLNRRGF